MMPILQICCHCNLLGAGDKTGVIETFLSDGCWFNYLSEPMSIKFFLKLLIVQHHLHLKVGGARKRSMEMEAVTELREDISWCLLKPHEEGRVQKE